MLIVDTIEKLRKASSILQDKSLIACDLEADGLDTKLSVIKGIGFGDNQNLFFIPFPNEIPKEELQAFFILLFQKTIIFHNAKYDMEMLIYNNLPIPKIFHDTMIMSWLIDENKRHGLKSLATEFLGREVKKWKQLDNQVTLLRDETDVINDLAEYCCEDVRNTFDLYNYFYPQLEKERVRIAYDRVELKLIPVLMSMEMRGIKVDVSMLQRKHLEAEKELKKLHQVIIDKIKELVPNYSAVDFNPRSPKQIEEVLFDVLKYPVLKETKGKKRSTDNEVLEDIVKKLNLPEDNIISFLLQFRDLDKVNGTYLVGLAEQAGLENVIHANFLQHGSRTGRLSSSDPNLQNIPTRHDQWDVRRAFVARQGYKFLMVDYNQIELRLLAHYSQDQNMVNTFKNGGDIHSKTMELIGTKVRRIAKNVNFAVVYGVGPRTLSHEINRSEEEAKMYIDNFFAGYPQVRAYITRVQSQTFKVGYVEMLTGRKRHFQEIYDKRWYAMIARQAINSKIQGSAADLMKIAMIKLDHLLKKLDAHMLVQIHDELIIETPIDKMEEVKRVVKDIMEHALLLRVPLEVSMSEGERWKKN